MRATTFRAASVLLPLILACVGRPALATAPSLSVREWSPSQPAAARSETLWIFDADFEDLVGDNAGWTVEDRSGTLGTPDYWHKDTIRINGFTYLGDSTWWCGTYNACWRQPRGYGNNWTCILSRDFPLDEWSDVGDAVTFEWDQRFAIEKDYDYGYFDVSTDGGATWTTQQFYSNPGFPGKPGFSQDWTSLYGHDVVDLSACAGQATALRFRFESDGAYSSQDQYNNPPANSCLDGAWQLDNFAWKVNGEVVWLDDCEAPGDNGWMHPGVPPTGQTGVTFFRGQFGIDFWTNRPPMPGEPPVGTWMYAAVDSLTSRMVDGERAYLTSPPIPVEGVQGLVLAWEGWRDCPCTADAVGLIPGMGDGDPSCIEYAEGWTDYWWCGAPGWVSITDNMNAFTGHSWFGLRCGCRAGTEHPGWEHMSGLFLDRVRVGVVPWASVSEEIGLPAQIAAVSPNPSRGSTRIIYSLLAASAVNVAVYDLTGRVVRTLVDGVVGPGEHEVVWDGVTETGVRAASGVYFVKLAAGDGGAGEAKLVFVR